MERVKSMHLFNNKLEGILDEEVREINLRKEKDADICDPSNHESYEAWLKAYRNMTLESTAAMGNHHTLQAALESCDHSSFKVLPRDGNDFDVPVLVHTPPKLKGKTGKPAIIYAHSGGVVAGTAAVFKPLLSYMAVNCGVEYYNVDYRLAPETKCPKNVLDFYCAVKYITENAVKFGIDPNRIAIAGDSGGGYIVFATMVMLAKNNEEKLLKLAVLGVPMTGDYAFESCHNMTKHERDVAKLIQTFLEHIATDLEKQRQQADPLLFPAMASDQLLTKMVPTIVWQVEFDGLLIEGIRVATRLREAGKLLELYILPGAEHLSGLTPQLKLFKKNMEDYKLAIETYLL